MSRLVSSLMLLSLMVMVVVVNTKPEPNTECTWPLRRRSDNKGCEKIPCHPNCHIDLGENPFAFGKREADAPMAHMTKRGKYGA